MCFSRCRNIKEEAQNIGDAEEEKLLNTLRQEGAITKGAREALNCTDVQLYSFGVFLFSESV